MEATKDNWRPNVNTRELGVHQLRGIAQYLDSKELPNGPKRSHVAYGMYHIVDYARGYGLLYNGGDWVAFMEAVNALGGTTL